MSTVEIAIWVTVAVGVAVRTMVFVTRWVSGGEERDTVSVSVFCGGTVTVRTTVTGDPPAPSTPDPPEPEPEPEPPFIGTTEYLGAIVATASACCSLMGSEYVRQEQTDMLKRTELENLGRILNES